MASSAPTPPHCTITAPKPFHPNPQTYPPHLSLPSRSTNTSASKSTPPVPLSHNPSTTFPSLTKSSSNPQQLPSNFSGRRSTRFVSKMHLGRPKTAVTSRHSSVAEEALREASRIHINDDKSLQSLLLYFEPKLSGSEDYNFLLRGLGNSGECDKALRCFEFAVQREKRKVEQGKLASSMISVLGRLGKVDLARSVFEDAVSKDYGNTVYAFSALISAYGRSGYCNEAIKIFESMKGNGLKPNLVTYNAIIDACGKGGMDFSRASEILDEMLMNGVHPDRITFNSLLAVCSRSGLWEAARDLFSEMVCRGIDPDIFTYNTLIDAFCKGGQMDLAYQIMSEMSSRNIMPNVVTYSTMIDGYAKFGRLEDAVNLLEDMKLAGVGLDRVSYNNLLSIYAKLGRFEEVVNVCKEMESSGIKKDAVTYNALLSGYGKQGKYEEVKRVFRAMKAERISPNLLTYSTLIDVYSKGGLHQEAMEVFRDFKRAGLKADVVLYSALIDALCKNGMVEAAVSLLDEMTHVGIKPNVVTYNSIIDAFGREATQDGPSEPAAPSSKLQVVSSSEVALEDGKEHKSEDNRLVKIFGLASADQLCRFNKDSRGNGEMLSILGIFHKMHELRIQPNVVTFSAILNACSRCNSYEDASMLLEELRSFDNQVYGVAHGLLMGRRDSLWVQAQSLFDEVKNMDSSTASAFYNALTDMLWHFGQKQGAQLVVLEGKRRHVWENVWSDSCLDLHLMSSGAARAMVHAWLLDIRSIVFEGHELPKLISILTGWGKHSKVVGDGALRRAIEALLTSIGAPFWVAECNLGRFISSGPVVTAWLKESSTLRVLVLRNDRSRQEVSRFDQLPKKLQALSL